MRKITHFALLLLIFFLTTISVGAQNNRSTTNNVQDMNIFYHTVESGQTVYSIARLYDVMVIDIFKLNPGSEQVIKAGEQLKIPQRRFEEKSILNVSGDDNYTIHTIQRDETIYSVSRQYNVSAERVLEANPGLSGATFFTGRSIRIPKPVIQQPVFEIVDVGGAKEVYYTVPPNETPYNICRRFKTTEEELLSMNPELAGGLRIGMTIRFPLRVSENEIPVATRPVTPSSNVTQRVVTLPANAAKIALFLPFNAGYSQPTEKQIQMTEYYEGLHLALDSVRKQGFSAEIFTYDVGNNDVRTRQLLQENREELRKANLLIGGESDGQIALIAAFAKQNNIKYLIPFSRNDQEVYNNPYVLLANTPTDYLNASAAYAGANLFGTHNIIFLDTRDSSNHIEFINAFKQELKYRYIAYKDYTYDAENFEDDILSLLSTTKPNMIMPVSRSLSALLKIKPVLRNIVETYPEFNLSLYGYPLWQTFLQDCLDDFHALDTYIYSYFYADLSHSGWKQFFNNYKIWYSKSPVTANPKYSMLGFDTGMFFFNAMHRYGVNFENRLSELNYKSLQNGFKFERVNDEGGFINVNLYIIHFNREYNIIRSDFR